MEKNNAEDFNRAVAIVYLNARSNGTKMSVIRAHKACQDTFKGHDWTVFPSLAQVRYWFRKNGIVHL